MGSSRSKHAYYLKCDKSKALEEFNETLKRQEYPKLNVLLLGKSGSGKSAFINTFNMVLRGRYVELARSGGELEDAKQNPEARHGGSGIDNQAISRKLLVYDMEKGMESSVPGGRAHNITLKCKQNRLPNMVYFCGIKTENIGVVRKIGDGEIITGTDVLGLIGAKGEHVPEPSTSEKPLRIGRIVFVVAADEDLPQLLITRVLEEFCRVDKEIQIFGVVTKVDIMKKKKRVSEMDQRIDGFISLLKANKYHYRVLPITNYIDGHEKTNDEQTDAAVLQFFATFWDQNIIARTKHCI